MEYKRGSSDTINVDIIIIDLSLDTEEIGLCEFEDRHWSTKECLCNRAFLFGGKESELGVCNYYAKEGVVSGFIMKNQ